MKMEFSDLIRQEQYEDIWVKNTSEGERRGNVFFTVPNSTGTREDQVTVFQSFVPTNLTDMVTRKQLLDSSSFRRALNFGLLTLISAEDAKSVLAEPGAKEEANRIRQLSVGSATAEAQFGVGKEATQITAASSTEGISNPVIQMADLMDTMDDDAALIQLRNLGALKIDEYRHLLRKAKSLRYEHTGRRCSEEIKRLKEQDDE